MTVLHAPVGVRSIVSFLVAFFIVASSIVFLFDRGQEAQVQMVVDHGRQEVKEKAEAGLQEPAIGRSTEAGDTSSKEECNWSRGQWVYLRQCVPAIVLRAQVHLHLPWGGLWKVWQEGFHVPALEMAASWMRHSKVGYNYRFPRYFRYVLVSPKVPACLKLQYQRNELCQYQSQGFSKGSKCFFLFHGSRKTYR